MEVDKPIWYSLCPTGFDFETWERLCPKVVDTGTMTRPPICDKYDAYQINGPYTIPVLNIWHIAQQLQQHNIDHQLGIYEDEEYISTRLVSGQATIYVRVIGKKKGGQELHIGQRGYLTEADYTALINTTGIRIEDGKGIKYIGYAR